MSDAGGELAAQLTALLEEARARGELAALADPLAVGARAAAALRSAGAAPGGGREGGAAIPRRFGIVGASEGMRTVFAHIERMAPSDLPVLVRGETGTGKELVARALHAGSPRAARPFFAENCAAVAATLLESELFGHRRGAFTDAVADRAGHFQAAAGGTLFLDEIGEMPLELQSKLLRALDRKEVRPVGADAPVAVDVRIVAATNRDLAAMVAERRFREDLYYRLNVVEILLPPLRERNGDVEWLVRYFLADAARDPSAEAPGIDDEALRALADFPWPGNVRQLQNEIQRALALASSQRLTIADLSEAVRASAAAPPTEAARAAGAETDGG